MGFRLSVLVFLALVLTFLFGTWLGNLIWPDSIILGAIIGGLTLGGIVLLLTKNIGR